MANTGLIAQQIDRLLGRPDSRTELEHLLTSNSNLPGPRGNLELAAAFAGCVEQAGASDCTWSLLLDWAAIPVDAAPTGNPREFLPFCALQGMGALFLKADADRRDRIVELFRVAANDGRWRLREGVAMAFQRIGERDFEAVRTVLSNWLDSATRCERRAIVAALAHPPMLTSADRSRYCLEVSDRILADVLPLDRVVRRTEEFRVLRQGLEYAISVFVAPLPNDGFAFLKRWAMVDDPDVKRIVKSNVGKNRLAGRYPEQVAEVLAVLGNS